MSLVQLFPTVLFEKIVVLKSAVRNWAFLKSRMFGKNYQKELLKKTECLANTYKSNSLSCKLPKRTRYI